MNILSKVLKPKCSFLPKTDTVRLLGVTAIMLPQRRGSERGFFVKRECLFLIAVNREIISRDP